MKKVTLTAASLAMIAMTASPAVAQNLDSTDNSVNDSFNDNSTNTQNCTQVVQQYNNVSAGDATASGDGAIAVVAAENNASIEAVQNCVQGDGNVVGGATGGDDYSDEGVVYEDDYSDDGAVHEDDGVVHEGGSSDDGSYGAVYSDEGVVYEDSSSDDGSYGAVYSASEGGETASATYSVLPDTGGASLIALGAGALLVGGGLLARRIVR